MNDDLRPIMLDALTSPVAWDGSPYYDIRDFARVRGDANARLVADLAEQLHAAVVRVQLANAEGHPILSAWLPAARAALTEAWRRLPPGDVEQRGAR